MAKYRKRPIVVEAIQITEETFSKPHPNPEHIPGVVYDPTKKRVEIETLEGTMTAGVGSWIITGVNGEQYPCKPDVFAKTYEKVED